MNKRYHLKIRSPCLYISAIGEFNENWVEELRFLFGVVICLWQWSGRTNVSQKCRNERHDPPHS